MSPVKLLFTRTSAPWALWPENKKGYLSRHPLPALCVSGVWEVFVGPGIGFIHYYIGGYYLDLHDPGMLVFKNGYAPGSSCITSWYLKRWWILFHPDELSWIGHMMFQSPLEDDLLTSSWHLPFCAINIRPHLYKDFHIPAQSSSKHDT